jgi:AcrR family transcriptional regulator
MAETHDTILQVARRLFIEQGYTATSIRQIAEEAGIGKATIYHHFPDKQAIILALLHNTTDRQISLLDVVRAETDPRRRIEVAVRMGTSSLLESVDVIQIVRREIPEGRDYMQSTFITFLKEYRLLLGETIRQGIEQGIFRPIDPVSAARVLMTMIQGTFAMTYLSQERSASPEQTAVALLDIFFNGIMAQH